MSKILETIQKLNSGMTVDELEKEEREEAMERARDEGKCFGECESCAQETCLVAEVNMCGPCTFGESETMGGNW